MNYPLYLNNCFNLHVHLSVCPFVYSFLSVWKLAPIPAVVSQNVTDKSCLVCFKNELCICILGHLESQGEAKPSYVHYVIRQEEAYLHISKLTSIFHQHPFAGPKQLFVLGYLGCTRKASISYFSLYKCTCNKIHLSLNTFAESYYLVPKWTLFKNFWLHRNATGWTHYFVDLAFDIIEVFSNRSFWILCQRLNVKRIKIIQITQIVLSSDIPKKWWIHGQTLWVLQ